MVDLRFQRPRFNEEHTPRMRADASTDTFTVSWIILYDSSVSVDLRHLISIAVDPRNEQEEFQLRPS
jgi:hypothetical protein